MFNTRHKYQETTLTASSYNTKISIEIPLDASAKDYFDAFKTLMIGLTFSPEAFDNAVVDYMEEHNLLHSPEVSDTII